MKRKVSVSIDSKVYKKAKDLGINVSKASENYLITLINAIEHANGNNTVFSEGFSAEKSSMVRSPGFEPGSSAWQSVDWRGFRGWLRARNYRGGWKSTLFGLARQYGEVLFTGDLSGLAELGDSERSNALKGLSAFSKFLGCYDKFQRLRKDYGLRWGGGRARMT